MKRAPNYGKFWALRDCGSVINYRIPIYIYYIHIKYPGFGVVPIKNLDFKQILKYTPPK